MPIEKAGRKRPWRCPLLGLVAVIGLVLSFQSMALAHKVYIYAWLEGDTVYTESYFGAGKKVKQGLIRVFDLSGQKCLEGRTNAKGEFSFRLPLVADLRIVVEAGMGHRGEFVLKAEGSAETLKPDITPDVPEGDPKSAVPVFTDELQIRMIVEQALDARLKQVMRELAEIRKERGPGFNEIIGGIGYIFGLMGLILYFKSRNKS